jgi:threonine/homoserine/homoserine lactone efflux protein
MVSTGQALAFSVMALAIILIPGPSVLFVIGRALAHGRRTALLGVVGNALGALTLTVGVAVGIGALVERSVVVFTVLKLAGAAYIIYLGVQAFRKRHVFHDVTSGFAAEAAGAHGVGRSLWHGYAVGVTNPKTIVFFAAVLPQFVDRSLGHAPVQMVVFGLIFALIALCCDSVWGLTAAGARAWFTRSPRRLAAVGGTGGLMMIGLGVAVAVTGRND